ncbi:MAG: glycogen debranching N-terminal domain-containing protein [Dehalococcoidia bacterium]
MNTSADEHLIHIHPTASEDHSRVLKHGETFVVCDRFGDIQPAETGDRGLYHEGTRHLSHLVLRINGVRPLLLSSGITADNAALVVDMTNPELPGDEGGLCPQDTIHLLRSKLLFGAACYERLEVANYGMTSAAVSLSWEFDADFRDVFEVRGTSRRRRGRYLPNDVADDVVELRYGGLDGRVRGTTLRFDPPPSSLDEERAVFWLFLGPGETRAMELSMSCAADSPGGIGATALTFAAARSGSQEEAATAEGEWARVTTSNDQFNEWLDRSAADIRMMGTETPSGPYVYAGVPWYSAPFGRDGIVTALETLTYQPALSAGVLRYLAATQATAADPASDAEPGKILHEARGGEMAALGEIPFARYYGSVDATPLFIVLADAYARRTGDHALIDALWPNLCAALDWIDGSGDPDGDGFVEYHASTERGLVNQGWKDSYDSVFHADGAVAEGPIALCEVQGYAFAARRAMARLARIRGDRVLAREQDRRAARLRRRFDDAFWDADLGAYALALDGNKRPCLVETSNPGHGLFSGIVPPARAARLARLLLDPRLFSGWGVRTLAQGTARFNPMSYHNGSVWPHDNALIAGGLSAYGFRAEAMTILHAQFDAVRHLDLKRMPELFCGFDRREGQGPTQYPVACLPQAWAAGAVFMLLDACLGLRIDAATRTLHVAEPALPSFLDDLTITGLEVADARADIRLQRAGTRVEVALTRATGPVALVIDEPSAGP